MIWCRLYNSPFIHLKAHIAFEHDDFGILDPENLASPTYCHLITPGAKCDDSSCIPHNDLMKILRAFDCLRGNHLDKDIDTPLLRVQFLDAAKLGLLQRLWDSWHLLDTLSIKRPELTVNRLED